MTIRGGTRRIFVVSTSQAIERVVGRATDRPSIGRAVPETGFTRGSPGERTGRRFPTVQLAST